jgi:hypothetical protein
MALSSVMSIPREACPARAIALALVCGGSRDSNHNAVMRIKSKASGRRAHSLMTAPERNEQLAG